MRPMETILPYLIAWPLLFLAGFVDAVAGGGGLISLPAYVMAGLPIHQVLGTNKMSNCMGTGLATFRLAKSGMVKWRRALPCAAMGLIGSFCGANLALLISDRVFRIIIVVVIPLTALYLMRGKPFRDDREELPPKRTLFICLLISLALGCYDGFYGPGTGTFLILLFTAAAHVSLNEAAGTAKVVNLTTNLSALAVFIMNGQVLFLLGITAGLWNMAGAYLGINMFKDKGAGIVKPIMLVVLALFMIKTVGELCGLF